MVTPSKKRIFGAPLFQPLSKNERRTMSFKTKIVAIIACLFMVGGGAAIGANLAGEDNLLSQSWTEMQKASLYSTYKKQNKNEAAKVELYWANGGEVPVVATAFGKALVLEAQAYWSLKAPPPPPPAAPTVTITGRPASPTTQTTATFSWTSTNATSFTCKIDTATASNCASPQTYSGVAVGTHSFTLTATGPGGTASANENWSVQAVQPPPPPPSGTPNLWIDSNGGTCTRTTGAAYNDASACASFAAAYTAASSGDTVGVIGSLGTQKFAGGFQSTQGAGTKTLTFKGSAGNKVRQIHFGSPNLTFDGINVDGGMVAQTGAGFENGGRPFVFKNGSIGNVLDEKGALVTESGIVFDNVLFYDVVLRGQGVHLECIMALSSEGMVIRNSTFRNCGIMDISVGIADWWSPQPGPYGNVTLEGNTFGNSRFDNGGCCATYSVALWATKIPNGSDYGQLNGWTIRNNYIEPGSDVIVRPTVGSNTVICGNTGNAPTAWKLTC